jgi:hypothetical protein
MNKKSVLAIILTLSFLSACAQPTPIAVQPSPTVGSTEVPPTPTHVPVDLTPAQIAAVQEVSKKYNLPVAQIQIASTEAVTWSNGCLGVVIPGVLCTDVMTQGFRILLTANGQQFEIHTNQDGTSVIDAAQLQATLEFVVQTSDHTIQVVNPNIPLGPTYAPAFNGFLPTGGAILGTAYVLDFTSQAKVVAVDANGSHDLSFIQNPTYGLAIWRGGEGSSSRLAWGTQLTPTTPSSSLQISAPDGSNLETLLTTDSGFTPGSVQLVAELWSADGQSLYFSKEPIGLGGYVPFSGASNLYKIDITSKEVTEIVPQASETGQNPCLEAISVDYRYVADNCTQNVITIRDLQGDNLTTIQAPADVTDYRLMGSARFSPTGDRVAFALAQGDPSNERGWIAMGDSSGGVAKLILVGNVGSYYTVQGWLDDQTLLVQSNSIGDPNVGNQIFTLRVDSSNPTKVADGSLLTVIDNR